MAGQAVGAGTVGKFVGALPGSPLEPIRHCHRVLGVLASTGGGVSAGPGDDRLGVDPGFHCREEYRSHYVRRFGMVGRGVMLPEVRECLINVSWRRNAIANVGSRSLGNDGWINLGNVGDWMLIACLGIGRWLLTLTPWKC